MHFTILYFEYFLSLSALFSSKKGFFACWEFNQQYVKDDDLDTNSATKNVFISFSLNAQRAQKLSNLPNIYQVVKPEAKHGNSNQLGWALTTTLEQHQQWSD